MKNITTIKKTAIEKTAMQKITTTALLFFLAFFSLTTNLKAQESGQQAGQARKTGWFVGVSPYFLGAEIKLPQKTPATLTEIDITSSLMKWITRTLDATVAFTTSEHHFFRYDQANRGRLRSDSSFVNSSD